MLPRERCDVDAGRFFSLSEKKVYIFKNLFQGFAGEEERCLVGSSHGWLVMWDFNVLRVHLFNPISGVRIKLPPLGFGPMPRVCKVFLSSDPSRNKKFFVVAIYVKILETKLAFHKHGDDGNNTTWTDLDSVPKRYDKLIFQNGLLFALSLREDSKSILVWDFRGTYPCRSTEFQPPEKEVGQTSFALYLVESLGEFLLVEKLRNLDSGLFYYDVHKLNFTPNRVECLKVKCLQNRALVLSENESASMSLSTLDFPELEANSIYVAQEYHSFVRTYPFDLYSTVAAYNLESKGFKSYFTSQVERRISYSPLIWIVPNPCQVYS